MEATMRFKTRLKSSNHLIDLTPLVDVIFLMLIFFMITSDILPLKSLAIENPTLTVEAKPLATELLIVMDAQEAIYVGSAKAIVDMGSLKEKLIEEIAAYKKEQGGKAPTCVLSVDRRCSYGEFLRLFSICTECSSSLRLVFSTEEENASA